MRKKSMLTKVFSIVAIFTIGLQATAKESKAQQKCDVLPKPENVVSVPEYSPDHSEERVYCDGDAPSGEKLQYEPTNDDVPIFKETTSEKEFVDGAFYRRAEELYIDPEPNFVSTREPILDAVDVESGSEKQALPEPATSVGQ